MRLTPAAALPLLLAAGAACAPLGAQRPLGELRPLLEQRIAQHRGIVGLALLDPRRSDTLAIRGDEPFPAASVIKVPILVELFHQVEAGRLRLEDPIVLLDIDKQPGTGVLRFLATPHELTVRDAASLPADAGRCGRPVVHHA